MEVRYTPPLWQQIRERRAGAGHPVVVRSNGHFVERVDPETRKTTGERQQFRLAADGSLKILQRADWVEQPVIVDVDGMKYG